MGVVKVTLHNTPDHWFSPGDTGHEVVLDDTVFRVLEVRRDSGDFILTYGLRLIPATVEVELERADEPVVIQ